MLYTPFNFVNSTWDNYLLSTHALERNGTKWNREGGLGSVFVGWVERSYRETQHCSRLVTQWHGEDRLANSVGDPDFCFCRLAVNGLIVNPNVAMLGFTMNLFTPTYRCIIFCCSPYEETDKKNLRGFENLGGLWMLSLQSGIRAGLQPLYTYTKR